MWNRDRPGTYGLVSGTPRKRNSRISQRRIASEAQNTACRTAMAGPHRIQAETPVVLTAGVSAWILWGPAIAVRHAVFCASLAVLLCEILLLRFRGVPLTRPYVPGRSRFHMLWAFYLSAFIAYTYSMADLETTLLRHGGVLLASALVMASALSFWLSRKLTVRKLDEVPFDSDVPDEMFRGFNLTEAYAAQAVASRHDR